ncbi:MAG TPA: hypothetical protein VFS23_26085 [Vicinamibacterales bacterium]|nr:hypothetical protein [Vicinamibacterales bacterium]
MKAHHTVFDRLALSLSLVTLITLSAHEASASCFTEGNRLTAARPQFSPHAVAAASDERERSNASIVGLWKADFLIGDGPDLFDQAFQQFHSDGTELMLSRGLPPSLGNVCVGIWQRTGPRTYKLKHTAWNWTPDGTFTGTFIMEATLRLSRSGDGFSGTWRADSFDTSGALIPDQHFEGTARAVRVGMD